MKILENARKSYQTTGKASHNLHKNCWTLESRAQHRVKPAVLERKNDWWGIFVARTECPSRNYNSVNERKPIPNVNIPRLNIENTSSLSITEILNRRRWLKHTGAGCTTTPAEHRQTTGESSDNLGDRAHRMRVKREWRRRWAAEWFMCPSPPATPTREKNKGGSFHRTSTRGWLDLV